MLKVHQIKGIVLLNELPANLVSQLCCRQAPLDPCFLAKQPSVDPSKNQKMGWWVGQEVDCMMAEGIGQCLVLSFKVVFDWPQAQLWGSRAPDLSNLHVDLTCRCGSCLCSATLGILCTQISLYLCVCSIVLHSKSQQVKQFDQSQEQK